MASTNPSPTHTDYGKWSSADLIARVTSLEAQLRATNASHALNNSPRFTKPPKDRAKRQFDPSKYNTRYIALKLAYLGQRYNGFEHHANNRTRLPTIEEELWKALAKTKLIFPTSGTIGEVDWDGCEYSKCGRTDKGVSAFGQVVALRVRSARPLAREVVNEETGEVTMKGSVFQDVLDELEYCRMLNRVLPEDIRILAWCPAPAEDFSARFSCKERQYRYFFTQPAYGPRPGLVGLDVNGRREGWLDIEAMKKAAKHFEEVHDFRNFCKVDGSKQITNFERRIFYAGIKEAQSCSSGPRYLENERSQLCSTRPEKLAVYYFEVKGSAFLWHQIRHMVAVLFLVGQGLEDPSVVQEMLDVNRNAGKPMYEMADDAPLVLWDCVFPSEDAGYPYKDTLPWIYPDSQISWKHSPTFADGHFGPGGTEEVLWAEWRRRKVDEVLAGSLLDLVAAPHPERHSHHPTSNQEDDLAVVAMMKKSTKVFDGGNGPKLKGDYAPLMQRDRMDLVDVQNHRYLVRKGLPLSDDPQKTQSVDIMVE